jgi:hypothetical protein
MAELDVPVRGDRPWTAQPPARATDASGNVQPDVRPWNRLGYGNNAIEVRYVDVI